MIVYKFYKPGCQPCATLGKIMKQMDLQDVQIKEIDMSLPENKERYPDIEVVPILRKENGEQTRLLPKYKLEGWLNENN
jgi:hypothetical protein